MDCSDSTFDARAVANCLLQLARENRLTLTHLQLQKIVFFAHGIHLQRFGAPLLGNRFEAWKYGPVVPELYHALKRFREGPVSGRATQFDIEKQCFIEVENNLPEQLREYLKEILLFFGRMDPWELVKLCHSPGSPWATTIERAKSSVNFSMVIDEALIRDFFVGNQRQSLQ